MCQRLGIHVQSSLVWDFFLVSRLAITLTVFCNPCKWHVWCHLLCLDIFWCRKIKYQGKPAHEVTCFQHQADLKKSTGLVDQTVTDLSAPQVIYCSARVVEAMRIFHTHYRFSFFDCEPL